MSDGFQLKMSFKGDEKVRAELKRLADLAPAALGGALFDQGEAIKGLAAQNAPRQSGYLRDSAYVNAPTERNGQISVELGFGAPYATRQHEDTKFAHREGHAKYLKSALDTKRSTFLSEVAAATWRNIIDGRGVMPVADNRHLTGRPGKLSAFRRALKRSRK